MMTKLIVYSRVYCHLCDDMVDALERLHAEYLFTIEVIDVDEVSSSLQQYDELVPVLVGERVNVHGVPSVAQLCHYFLDECVVREFLKADAIR